MRENSLQTYLDRISELILEKELKGPGRGDNARNIARVRTLTTLDQLDGKRKAILLRFLFESGLLNQRNLVIELSGANMRNADFFKVDFDEVDLSGVDFQQSVLMYVNFQRSSLKRSDLSNSKLYVVEFDGADLAGLRAIGTSFAFTDFAGANLCGASFKGIDPKATSISEAKELSAVFTACNFEGAVYDHETTWPDGFDPFRNGAVLKSD